MCQESHVFICLSTIYYTTHIICIYILQIGPEVSAGVQGCGDEH